jgi:hypothetical protein
VCGMTNTLEPITPAACCVDPHVVTTWTGTRCLSCSTTTSTVVVCSWCDDVATHGLDTSRDQRCATHDAQWFGGRHARTDAAPESDGVSLYRPRHSTRVTPYPRQTPMPRLSTLSASPTR